MMGRKARKTRWRTLNIDEQSDSEDSNTAGGVNLEKGYQNGQKSFYSRFTFSSQSTPTRRYNHDIKSTRSSSTASETKVTFNEDEYTRITTPRQDVLFKKGYLNKPKTYQTQTSTGTSTNSTGHSTGNGTPDHQSADGTEGTDVEYESQFVFPNGFVDQNGIYYINSYEPYPLVVYNAPVCYPEIPRPKRYSTGSLTESASPNNEENSQSGGEANGVQDFNHHQVYNVVYHQGYYYGNTNGTNNNEANCETEPSRRVKKKRRRKLSKTSKTNDDDTASEYTDDEVEEPKENGVDDRLKEEPTPSEKIPLSVHEQNGCDESKCDENVHCDRKDEEEEMTPVPNQKFDLKPDAEEFIPKAYREPVVDPNIQFVNFQPNFVPIPIMGDIPPPQYPPPFLPPAIPINFVPPNAKLVPNFVNFVPNFIPKTYPVVQNEVHPEEEDRKEEEVEERLSVENKQHFVTPNETAAPAKVQKIPNKTDIDIEKIVSKLEEAAKEQRLNENKRQKFNNSKTRYYQPKKREERFAKPEVRKAQNYSTMVKTAQKGPRYPERQSKVETPPPKAKKPTTQWISVASRKKRKNKSGNENEEALPEDEVLEENDGFESYDVNQLVDVVVAQPQEEVVKIEESADIPKEETPEVVVVVEKEEEPLQEVVIEEEPAVEKVVDEEEVKVTKKPKKNSKSQTKRIIIKDTYEVTAEEPAKAQKEVAVVATPPPPPPPEPVTAISESPVSTPEKRTKRKKKKPQKPSIAGKSVSVSSSNTTLNNCDDSYDFLLEPSVLDETEDKTNVEISQELDRLIQKGMYNNLEEKIKSLNSSFASDNFFSSINLTSPLTFEKNNFLKSNEFSSLFKTTTNLLAKPKRYDNDDYSKLNIDFSKIQQPAAAEPQPSTSKAGIFLENPEVNEILKDTGAEVPKLEEVTVTKSKSNGKSKSKQSKKTGDGEEQQKKTSEDTTKLYPITQAVKEWMTKTRENTPEVELLKSPTTIKKELCENEAKEEEVVLFSTEDWSVSRESSVETDLLDCWENDVKSEEKPQTDEEDKPKAGEETIEIYESKYGKNEDYLKIQTEVEEKTRKINGNFPKHGNLPYRAICCSIM